MRFKVPVVVITVSTGGFMLVDGVRNLLTGTYFGSSLGPWSNLVRAVGFDPQHFGAVFSLLGLAWFLALAALLTNRRWAVPLAGAVGILTLWYVPLGTFFAVVYLALISLGRNPSSLSETQ